MTRGGRSGTRRQAHPLKKHKPVLPVQLVHIGQIGQLPQVGDLSHEIHLFARLAVRYGSAWAAKWEGLDMAAVRADWADELAGYAKHPDAIKHALANLPTDRPPNVLQFILLCRNAPEPMPLMLPKPAPTDEEKAKVRSLLQQARERITGGAS